MIFRRVIFNAILIGVFTGLLISGVQMLGLTDIIYQAETYEVAGGHDHGGDEHGSHEHGGETWAPDDGGERIFYTVISNIFVAIGFSAVILAVMSQCQLQGLTRLTLPRGLVWGVAGFITFFVAPGLGLPPEIPGAASAALEQRQLWWLLTVVCVALGLAVLAFAPVKIRLLGVVSIALPYLVGAPRIEGPEFTHPDPAAVEALTELHHQFIVASGVSSFVFWVVLGVASAWVLNKRVLARNTGHAV